MAKHFQLIWSTGLLDWSHWIPTPLHLGRVLETYNRVWVLKRQHGFQTTWQIHEQIRSRSVTTKASAFEFFWELKFTIKILTEVFGCCLDSLLLIMQRSTLVIRFLLRVWYITHLNQVRCAAGITHRVNLRSLIWTSRSVIPKV